MIGKVSLGKSFYGAVAYVMGKKEAQVLLGSGVRSENPVVAAKDFESIRNMKPQIKNAVWHASISFAYEDKVGNDLMLAVATDYIKAIGLDESQYLIVRHNDQRHQHFHLIANRVKYDGKIVSDRWCKNRTARVCDQLEVKYGLVVARSIQHRHQKPKDKVHSIQEKKSFVKEAFLTMASKAKPKNFDEVTAYLKAKGIEMQLHIQKTGRINGVSFRYDGISFKGSALGAEFKYKKILELLSGTELQQSSHHRKDEPSQPEKQKLEMSKPVILDMVKKDVADILRTKAPKDLIEFKALLKIRNIDLIIKVNSNYRATDLTYCYMGLALSDRVLGKEFALKNIRSTLAFNEIREFHPRLLNEPGSIQRGRKPFASKLQVCVKEFFELDKTEKTFDEFRNALLFQRIEPLINVHKNGTVIGVLFKEGNSILKGSVIEKHLYKRILNFFNEKRFKKLIPPAIAARYMSHLSIAITQKIDIVEKAIQDKIEIIKPRNLSELRASLLDEEIEIQIHISKSDKIGSISFLHEGLAIKGTSLSPDYSVLSLQKVFERNQTTEIKANEPQVSLKDQPLLIDPSLELPVSVPVKASINEKGLYHIQKSIHKICTTEWIKDLEELRTLLTELKIEFKIISDNGKTRDIMFIYDGLQAHGSDLNPPFSLDALLKLFNSNKALRIQKNSTLSEGESISPTAMQKVDLNTSTAESNESRDPKFTPRKRLKMKN